MLAKCTAIIAVVRGVIVTSIRSSSMLRVSGLMSTNTATAPLNTNALAVDANVNDGMITSSPGWISQSSAVISRAAVPDGVRRTSGDPVLADSQSLQSFVNGPSPDSHPV